jgi:hypothetical protein
MATPRMDITSLISGRWTIAILIGLTIESPGEHDGNPSHGRGVRAMTPTVGAEGLEPPTFAL